MTVHTARIIFYCSLHCIKFCYCSVDGSADAIGGGAVAGRKAVDFENLAFAQGNHLMTNKKCDLPQKSYRAAHKASLPVCMPYTLVCEYSLLTFMRQVWRR